MAESHVLPITLLTLGKLPTVTGAAFLVILPLQPFPTVLLKITHVLVGVWTA